MNLTFFITFGYYLLNISLYKISGSESIVHLILCNSYDLLIKMLILL